MFHLDFNGQNFNDEGALVKTLEEFLTTYEKVYGGVDSNQTIGTRFAKLLKSAHQQTGLRCVVLIDEYDKPLLDVMGLPETIHVNNVDITLEENHRNILKAFYSTLIPQHFDLTLFISS